MKSPMPSESLPVTVGLLGYGGLIPFVVLAMLSVAEPSHGILYRGALMLYGAVILSFVGAIHWGVAMASVHMDDATRRACYVWSVVPSLMAWSTFVLSPIGATLTLVLGFILQYWRDRSLGAFMPWPKWYLPLRIRLTFVACGALFAGVVLPILH